MPSYRSRISQPFLMCRIGSDWGTRPHMFDGTPYSCLHVGAQCTGVSALALRRKPWTHHWSSTRRLALFTCLRRRNLLMWYILSRKPTCSVCECSEARTMIILGLGNVKYLTQASDKYLYQRIPPHEAWYKAFWLIYVASYQILHRRTKLRSRRYCRIEHIVE